MKFLRSNLFLWIIIIKKNGIYVLGLHLIANERKIDKVTQWTAKRGALTIRTIMSMVKLDKIKRRETLRVELKIKTNKIQDSVISIYQLRTYTLLQLRKILKNVPELEIINVYDEYYDLSNPISLNSGSDYAVLLLRKN